MSLELVNTFATLGTFLVIAATAIAAIVQLRHARSSNQIAALNELRETMATSEFQGARHFVFTDLSERLKDPAVRYQLLNQRAMSGESQALLAKLRTVGNLYENLGVFVKSGLADRDLILDMWSTQIVDAWEALASVASVLRRKDAGVWENFEYLAVLSEDWLGAFPSGTYPPGVRRIDLQDTFLEADKQYAASLAPA